MALGSAEAKSFSVVERITRTPVPIGNQIYALQTSRPDCSPAISRKLSKSDEPMSYPDGCHESSSPGYGSRKRNDHRTIYFAVEDCSSTLSEKKDEPNQPKYYFHRLLSDETVGVASACCNSAALQMRLYARRTYSRLPPYTKQGDVRTESSSLMVNSCSFAVIHRQI